MICRSLDSLPVDDAQNRVRLDQESFGIIGKKKCDKLFHGSCLHKFGTEALSPDWICPCLAAAFVYDSHANIITLDGTDIDSGFGDVVFRVEAGR